MKLSRDRVNSLARTLVDQLSRQGSAKLIREADAVRQAVAHALVDEVKRLDEQESRVLQRIAAMTEVPASGSKEWDSLYSRLLAEEHERLENSNE